MPSSAQPRKVATRVLRSGAVRSSIQSFSLAKVMATGWSLFIEVLRLQALFGLHPCWTALIVVLDRPAVSSILSRVDNCQDRSISVGFSSPLEENRRPCRSCLHFILKKNLGTHS